VKTKVHVYKALVVPTVRNMHCVWLWMLDT